MRTVGCAILGLALASGAAGAIAQTLADLPMKPPIYRRAAGSASPIPSSAAYMPARAAAERRDGEVVIACVLSAKGRLDPCRVVSERPRGFGFAAAALQMAANRHVTAKPTIEDGMPRDGELVQVKIEFSGKGHRF